MSRISHVEDCLHFCNVTPALHLMQQATQIDLYKATRRCCRRALHLGSAVTFNQDSVRRSAYLQLYKTIYLDNMVLFWTCNAPL